MLDVTRRKGGTHQGLLPPARSLVLRQTVEDDRVEDGRVGADPVGDVCPVLPLVFSLVLDPTALDTEPHCPPDPVLVRDVLLGEHSVGLLLVQLDADVPGLVAPHFVKLGGVGTVHSDEALQVWPWSGTFHREESVDREVLPITVHLALRTSNT